MEILIILVAVVTAVSVLVVPAITIVALFQKMSWRQELKRQAKQRLKESGSWMKFSLLFAVIVILGLLFNGLLVLLPLGLVFSTLLQLIYVGFVTYGLVQVSMRIKRQETFELHDFFDTSELTRVMTLTFVQEVYLFLWRLLVIPGVIKQYSYSQTYFLLYENPHLSTDELISQSRGMMKGHKWELFILDASFLGWAFLAILTFGILGFYIAPLYFMARLGFYEYVKVGYIKSTQHQNVCNIYN